MKISEFTLSALFLMSNSYSTSAFAPASRGGAISNTAAISSGIPSLAAATDGQSRFQLMATTTSEEIIPREVLFGNPKYASTSVFCLLHVSWALFSMFFRIGCF
jgi:hypothetical protein